MPIPEITEIVDVKNLVEAANRLEDTQDLLMSQRSLDLAVVADLMAQIENVVEVPRIGFVNMVDFDITMEAKRLWRTQRVLMEHLKTYLFADEVPMVVRLFCIIEAQVQ